MLTYNNLFEKEIKQLVNDEVSRITEVILNGTAIQSMEDYRNYTGQIKGLRKIIEFCDFAQETLNKR